MKSIKKLLLLIIGLSYSLFAQWAMWANPSMPVGNSEHGVGLWKGQIMFTIDNIANYIDWWHEPTDSEPFDHAGDLLNYTVSPTLSIGLNNIIDDTPAKARNAFRSDKSAFKTPKTTK